MPSVKPPAHEGLGNPALAAALAASMKGGGGQAGHAAERGRDVQGALHDILIVAGGMGAAVFALWYIGRKIGQARSTASINRGDDYGSPEGFALRFSEAMDGLGTNEDLILELAASIPHRRFWDDVQRAYAAQTRGGNLTSDLRGELSDWWFQKVFGVIALKPSDERERKNPESGIGNDQVTQWAIRINDAAEYTWGTDEDALLASLEEIPTAAAVKRVDEAYRAMYGYGLLYELTDEMSGGHLDQAYDIITHKPDANGRSIQQILQG